MSRTSKCDFQLFVANAALAFRLNFVCHSKPYGGPVAKHPEAYPTPFESHSARLI